MRVLLDESLPRQLARELPGYDVRTVVQQRWTGLKNGELLRRAKSQGFEVFALKKLPQFLMIRSLVFLTMKTTLRETKRER